MLTLNKSKKNRRFTNFKQVKKINSHFANFEQVKKINSRFVDLKKFFLIRFLLVLFSTVSVKTLLQCREFSTVWIIFYGVETFNACFSTM